MNKFTTIEGDLLSAQRGVIIHGCNDRGVMNSGVAAGVRTRFPGAYDVYREAFNAGELKIGTLTVFQVSKDLWIINAVTQTLGGFNPLSYPGLKECFARTLDFVMMLEIVRGVKRGTMPLLFPLIGAGRAGGDWTIISALINDALEKAEVAYGPREAVLYTVKVEPADCR